LTALFKLCHFLCCEIISEHFGKNHVTLRLQLYSYGALNFVRFFWNTLHTKQLRAKCPPLQNVIFTECTSVHWKAICPRTFAVYNAQNENRIINMYCISSFFYNWTSKATFVAKKTVSRHKSHKRSQAVKYMVLKLTVLHIYRKQSCTQSLR